jgi:hypothetical protein
MLPSNFSSRLKVSTKQYSFLMKSNQQSSSCHHTVRASLYCPVNFLFYASQMFTADKATIRFRRGMKCHTKQYSVLEVKSVWFSNHINCFPGHIFTNNGQLFRLLSHKLLNMHKGTNILLVYQHILITWQQLKPSIPRRSWHLW